MIPNTPQEIEKARKECRAMLGKRALASAAAGLSPIIGPDIAVDMALLLGLLPRINRRFDLTPEQIDSLDEKAKIAVYQFIRASGKALAGKYITQELVKGIVQKLGIRIGAKTIAKYVPFIGLVISSIISYGGMQYMGRVHIDECVELCEAFMKNKDKAGS